jgi:uncharacterized protein (DUF305 family)
MENKMKNALIAAAALAFLLSGAAAQAEEMMHKECMPMVKTGNQDADFIRNMIPHHKMALDMAEKQLKDGKDKEARSMAENIISAQKKEIADMEAWLKSHK